MTFGVKIEGSTALDAAGVLYILIYLPTIENAYVTYMTFYGDYRVSASSSVTHVE